MRAAWEMSCQPIHQRASLRQPQRAALDELPTEVLLKILKFLELQTQTGPSDHLRHLSLVNKRFRNATVETLFSKITLSYFDGAISLSEHRKRIERLGACEHILKAVRHLDIKFHAHALNVDLSPNVTQLIREQSIELMACATRLTTLFSMTCSTLKKLSFSFEQEHDFKPAFFQVFASCKAEFLALESLSLDIWGPVTFISQSPNLKRLEMNLESPLPIWDQTLVRFQVALKRMKRLSCLEHLALHNVRDKHLIRELGASNLGVKSLGCVRNVFGDSNRGFDISIFHWLKNLSKLPKLRELFLPIPFKIGLDRFVRALPNEDDSCVSDEEDKQRAIGGLSETCGAARWAFYSIPKLDKLWVGVERADSKIEPFTRTWFEETTVILKDTEAGSTMGAAFAWPRSHIRPDENLHMLLSGIV